MKKIKSAYILIFLTIISIIIFLFLEVQQGKEQIPKPEKGEHEYLLKSKSRKLEGIDIESIIEYGDYYVLGVHYPITTNHEINEEVSKINQDHISNFKKDASEFFEGTPPEGGFSSWVYELNIDYNVFRSSDEVVSFKFDVHSFTGGAHSIHEIYTKTYNLDTGYEFMLNDVFKKDSDYLNILSKISSKQLTESGRLGDYVNEDWIKDGTSPSVENFKHFVLTNNSIIFHFSEFQVAPWVAGPQYVEIEYEELKNILSSEFFYQPFENEDDEFVETPEEPVQPPIVNTNGSPVIALTFDDGPHPSYTALILDELKKRNAVATFFVLGNRVQYYPELLSRIVAEGSEIGNHTWNHKQLTRVSPEEIRKQLNDTQEVIKNTVGFYPTIMRPPYGSVDSRVRKEINMPIILWSVDTEDWKSKDREKIVAHILSKSKNGDITLQHDIYKWTAESVGPILDDLIAKGYKFVTVSQLLGFNKDPSTATPGKLYHLRK
ncbi:polysaccharide deacetylase family protein [Wukongibacter baidiensis]|uniref:polysaccharide deacetylase family protein n=1 Tax=Wukongibacter baidiensis TaxID=1723361 RepID=UPI003D7F35CC